MPESNQHSERWFFEYGFIGPHADADDSVVAAIEKLGFEFVYGGAVTDGDWKGYPAEFERLQEQLEAERKMREIDQRQCDDMTDQAGRLAVELADLREQVETLEKEIARLKTDRGMWHHEPNPARRPS